MKTISKRVYISIMTLILLLVASITSSYAWIQLNNVGFIKKISLDIAGGDGMSISLDGSTFKSRLSSLEVKEAVLRKCDPNYTPGMSENEINALFNRFEFAPLTTEDDPLTPENELFNTFHAIDDSTAERKYLALDVFVNTNVTEYPIEVYFARSEMVTAVAKPANLFTSLPATNLPSCFGTEPLPTDIKVSAANAVRVGVVTYDIMDSDNLTTSPNVRDKKIYSIGSDVPSLNNDIYNFGGINASYNANLIYYDMMLNKDISANKPTNRNDELLDCQNIISSDAGLVKDKIAKMTIYVWLEGWDADCFNAVASQTMNIELKFASYDQSE